MMNSSFGEITKWNRKEPLIVRVDYGFPLPVDALKTFDALFEPIIEIKKFFDTKKDNTLVAILNSHHLLSPRRKERLFQDFLKSLEGKPAVLETRFFKIFKIFCSLFEKENISFSKIDVTCDGSLPPLYSAIQSNRDLFFKNLFYEWESALLVARGRSSLIDIAKMIAENENPLTLSELAQKMGLTLGAVASYLSWMEEASLIRKENRRFFLRHIGLNLLFKKNFVVKKPTYLKTKKDDLMEMD